MPKSSQIPRLGVALAACLCSSACLRGELEHVGVEFDRLVDRTYDFESGDRILVGSRLCPEFVWWSDANGEGHYLEDEERRADLRACYDESLTGAGEFDEGCLLLDDPGEATWQLDADPGCTLGNVESDLFRFTVIEPDDQLRLGFDDWQARAFAGNLLWGAMLDPIGLAPGNEAEDLFIASDQTRHVLAGEDAVLALRLDDPQGQVFWAAQDDVFEVVGDGITLVANGDEQDGRVYPGEVVVRVDEGAVGLVRVTVAEDVQLESPSLIGVPRESVQNLDVVAIVNSDGVPVAARAVVRDDQGRILQGARIDWDVTEGALGVTPGRLDNAARTPDYALLEVGCEAPPNVPTQRRAELRAQYSGLEDSVTLEWTAEPGSAVGFEPHGSCIFAQDDDDDDDDDEGEGGGDDEGAELDDGCNCSTEAGSGAGVLGVLGLFGLMAVRRRRR